MNIYYIVVVALVIGLTVKNIIQISRMRNEKVFVDVYSKVLNQTEDAYESLLSFIDKEKSDALRNKARVLLVYEKLNKDEDVSDILTAISFKDIFYTNGKFNKKEAAHHTDVFIWLSLLFARAKSKNNSEVIDALNSKVIELNDILDGFLEYHMYKAVYASVKSNKDEDYTYFKKMLDGEYSGVSYEKRLIGLYKRIAASFLVYNKEEIDEFYENDLHDFSTKLLGKVLLTDLDLYDKYLPKEEEPEELKEEVKEEEK